MCPHFHSEFRSLGTSLWIFHPDGSGLERPVRGWAALPLVEVGTVAGDFALLDRTPVIVHGAKRLDRGVSAGPSPAITEGR
jgi:hypothetical protein